MSQQAAKAKGVVDLVFLLDVTGSMQPCIDALKENIRNFIDFLTVGDLQACPVKDWRAKVVGYRDFTDAEAPPFIDNPFVRDASALKAQLAGLEAAGGGDIPESLLDALYKVAMMDDTPRDQEDPQKWRYRSTAARVVVVFTDAPFKEPMSIPEARGGTVNDIANIANQRRIILSIFAPDLPCYNQLAAIDKAEYEAINFDAADPLNAQKALATFTADRENFKNTLKALAASVSKSAEAIVVQ